MAFTLCGTHPIGGGTMTKFDFLDRVRTLAVICTQWGDTGKGKFVDYFASWADIIGRGTGGANAGHTIRVGRSEYVFHLLPSGMLHAKKLNVIGSGVAVEPGTVIDELEALKRFGVSGDNLRIALNARLVLPQHMVMDRLREQAGRPGRIGTTGRGMGPAYTDHTARVGLVVNDLLNPHIFCEKLSRNLEEKVRLVRAYDPTLAITRSIMDHPILNKGVFFSEKNVFDEEMIAEVYLEYGSALKRYIIDTDALIRTAHAEGSRILLEGAQGNLLSVDYGTYPYVTSSDCSIAGLAKGVGLREQDVDLTLGIVKAFYMTRVGEGPFPTELGGERSAQSCRVSTRASEKIAYPDASLNDPDEFVRGVAIRRIGNEYGATTGRPRRTGWLDLPLIRYSAGRLTGPNVILTKLDVLDGADSFKVCTEYVYEGPDYRRGEFIFRTGQRIVTAMPDLEIMQYCRPHYVELPGWPGPIRAVREYQELDPALRQAIEFLEESTDINVMMLSVGPDREDTIVVKGPK